MEFLATEREYQRLPELEGLAERKNSFSKKKPNQTTWSVWGWRKNCFHAKPDTLV